MGRDNCFQSEISLFRKYIKDSNQYMDWLSKYSLKHESLSTGDCFSKKNISRYNRKNISRLPLLYELIDSYAKDNYIKPNSVEEGCYYAIKDRDNHYYIGIDYSDNLKYYCVRSESSTDEVDFSFIRFGIKIKRTIEIDYYLNELGCHIEEIINKGVPYQEVQNKTFDVIRKIRVKKYNNK